MLRQDDYAKSKLVEAGWLHGREFGGHLASCLIMSCIANRQRLGWGSWLEVIDSIPKYSATIEQPSGIPVMWEPNFVRLLKEVEAIYDGSQDFAKGGLYWFDSAKPVTNEWFQEKIVNNKEDHKVVGNMNSLMLIR